MKKEGLNGFRIYRHETLHDFFVRVVMEQFQLCIALCRSFAENPDYTVHEIRKATKRLRSVYRLFQLGIETEGFENAHRQCAGISNLLAAARRNEVFRQSLALLIHDRSLKPVHQVLEKLLQEITIQHNKLTVYNITTELIPEQIEAIIEKEKQWLLNVNLRHANINILYTGWKRTYRQGYHNLKAVIQNTNTTTIHNLRKRVKMIWNQLLLFQPIWPAVLNGYISQFDRLAEKLGMDHDLAELEGFIRNDQHVTSPGETRQLLLFLSKKRGNVQQNVIPLATKLFAEKPGEYAGRMITYCSVSVLKP